jgi:uncharacterized protein
MNGPMNREDVHLFIAKNKRFALDVNSGIFYELDELNYDIVDSLCDMDETDLVKTLSRHYPKQSIIDNLRHIEGLIQNNILFSPDRFVNYQEDKTQHVSAICLHIAHCCNLRCAYCYAYDSYNKDNTLMSKDVAEHAIQFLIKNSSNVEDLNVSFFGGEPLLNKEVLFETVEYALSEGKRHHKNFNFHITTNGTLLTREALDFLDNNNFSMILSFDGPEAIHDKSRPYLNGEGSFKDIYDNLRAVLLRKISDKLTVRSTFTLKTRNIEEIMTYLSGLGITDMSIEPAYLGKKYDDLEIKPVDVPKIFLQYQKAADKYLEELSAGKYYSFFHLKKMMDKTHRVDLKLTQCGASAGYVAIGADGKIYPCHRFVGKTDYVIGDVYEGITREDIRDKFVSAHVRNKKKCMGCWARYICGGGCHALADLYNDNIFNPYDVECELFKYRVELGAYIYSRLQEKCPGIFDNIFNNKFC